jgi:CMP-N,N'-diacetyllegionaminic acid synthase
MINGKRVLGIIPARGGSKGIPRKNVQMIAGKPLIAWSIEEAKRSIYLDRTIVSTEDDEIRRIAAEYGGDIPFLRPAELSQDQTRGVEPVLHALTILTDYDYVVLLQPTSPLRKANDIDECIKACIDQNALSCISVTLSPKPPQWMYHLASDRKLSPILEGNRGARRQELQPAYAVNGAVYVAQIEWLKQVKEFFIEGETIGYTMAPERSIDIDSPLDFSICEYLLEQNHRKSFHAYDIKGLMKGLKERLFKK